MQNFTLVGPAKQHNKCRNWPSFSLSEAIPLFEFDTVFRTYVNIFQFYPITPKLLLGSEKFGDARMIRTCSVCAQSLVAILSVLSRLNIELTSALFMSYIVAVYCSILIQF